MLIDIIIFLFSIIGIVFITRNMLISSIRKLAIYLKWSNKIVGQILGYATSTPELINTIVAASLGLISTTEYNVLSSNIINLIFVFLVSLYFKKIKSVFNINFLKEYLLISLTIVMPIILITNNASSIVMIVPSLIIIYLLFIITSRTTDYFIDEEEILEKEARRIKRTENKEHLKTTKLNKYRKKKIRKHIIIITISIIIIYLLGNLLSGALEGLSMEFGIPEIIIGILMGIVTSIPELITFITTFVTHKRATKDNKASLEVVSNLLASNISNLCIVQTTAIIIYNIFN